MAYITALIFFLALCPTVTKSQVFEIGVGDSSLEGIAGASTTVYLPSSTVTASAGRLSDGSVRYSLAWLFKWHGWDVTAGDSQFSFASGLSGLGIAARGVSFEKRSDNQTIAFFGGAVGSLFSAPFATTFTPQTGGAGIFYERRFAHIKVSSLEVFQGVSKTSLQAVTFDWRTLSATATVGWLQSAREFQGQAVWRPTQRISFLVNHENYYLGSTHAVVDFLNASAGSGRVDGYLSAFHSAFGWGESAGAGLRLAEFFSVRQAWAVAPNQAPLYLSTATETLRHWSASQSWSNTGGRNNFGFGGSYHTNRLSASVGEQLLFNISTGKFQSFYVASLTLHAANASVNVATSLNRAQKIYLYGASGEDFLGSPASSNGHSAAWISTAKFEITGRVLDMKQNPVEGAALEIGGVVAYSDNLGNFSMREKKSNPVPFAVLPDEFAAPGKWRVISAPTTAEPSAAVTVIVSK